jgi:6-phosphogluconolactonase
MKKNMTILFLLLLYFSVSAQDNSKLNLYVGTYTSEGSEGIYLCSFEETTGSISMNKVFKGIDNPSFMQTSSDGKYLYTVASPGNKVEKSGGYVQAYRISKEGDLHFINKQLSNGVNPCHVDVSPDGKFAAAANYGSGTVSLYKINTDGGLKEASMTIYNEGSGTHPSRQKGPHAHSVKFSPNGRQLYSADLGTDLLSVFDIKGDKIISASQSYLKLAPGAGPRHFTFHPGGKAIYVINELNSTITIFKKGGKKWKEEQVISTVPAGYTGPNYCADIHISDDGRYLYGSNRGHNSIAVFKVDDRSKQLTWITSVSTYGDWPRNFALSPNGKYLLAANQRSGNVTVFSINPETGIPEFTGNELKIVSPVCLVFH